MPYPDRGVRESVFEDPEWGHAHKEMAKVGVNLRLLHDEYRERCRREGKVAMGCTEFLGDCGTWTTANNLTERIEHEAGAVVRSRLVGPHAGEGAGESRYPRGPEDLPVRRRAAVQPDGLLRVDARHEGGDVAQVPRAHVRVPGSVP